MKRPNSKPATSVHKPPRKLQEGSKSPPSPSLYQPAHLGTSGTLAGWVPGSVLPLPLPLPRPLPAPAWLNGQRSLCWAAKLGSWPFPCLLFMYVRAPLNHNLLAEQPFGLCIFACWRAGTFCPSSRILRRRRLHSGGDGSVIAGLGEPETTSCWPTPMHYVGALDAIVLLFFFFYESVYSV